MFSSIYNWRKLFAPHCIVVHYETVYNTTFSFALNGGGRIFLSPSSPLSSLLCSLVSLRDSLCTALQTKRLWIWSTGLLMQLTLSETWVFGEPDCPDGTFAAGYTMDAWERWRIVCLAAPSVEDIEDIYLFVTMIRGILLIGLGFALGYRRIQKTGTAVQSPTRLPVWLKHVGRAVSIETETINRNMDSIKEKLTALQRENDYMETKMDRESSLQNWNAFTRPKDKTILSFSGSPSQWPWQGCCCDLHRESNAVRRSCVPPPPYRDYRHCPSLDHSPSFALIRQPVKRVWPAPD